MLVELGVLLAWMMQLLVALGVLLAWMMIVACSTRSSPCWGCTWLVALGIHLVLSAIILDLHLVLDYLVSMPSVEHLVHLPFICFNS
jgi:hypothetical protein